jgi:hypothetical protein
MTSLLSLSLLSTFRVVFRLGPRVQFPPADSEVALNDYIVGSHLGAPGGASCLAYVAVLDLRLLVFI